MWSRYSITKGIARRVISFLCDETGTSLWKEWDYLKKQGYNEDLKIGKDGLWYAVR